jgi:hypothetical protein
MTWRADATRKAPNSRGLDLNQKRKSPDPPSASAAQTGPPVTEAAQDLRLWTPTAKKGGTYTTQSASSGAHESPSTQTAPSAGAAQAGPSAIEAAVACAQILGRAGKSRAPQRTPSAEAAQAGPSAIEAAVACAQALGGAGKTQAPQTTPSAVP